MVCISVSQCVNIWIISEWIFIQYVQAVSILRLAETYQALLNPLNAELNPIRHLLALVGARHIVHVSGIKKNSTGHIA